MQWLNELPFADNRVLQIGFLAACGIAALIVLAIFYRLTFAHRLRVPGVRTRQPRLGLVDAFSLDGQRQLVLVRRDNVEHLVMIGGPNDVLVESQINRAVAPARDSNQVSPLLVPSAPARRTEAAPLAAPAAAEAPAKVAAKAPAAPAAPTAPTAAPPIPKATAPAQPTAPVSAQAAASPAPAPKPIPPEPARSAAAPPQTAEPTRPAPASPPPRQPEPRPVQPRATMPPPIIPANASPDRGAAVRATERAPARGPGNPPAPPPVAPAPARRPETPESAVAASKAEPPPVATVKTEAPAGPTVTVAAASAASVQARPAPKTPPAAPASDGAQKPADARSQADKANAAGGKPLKVDDPFADLDSLEAEMARLLGREKSD
jgi:flagellar protein FliO/FliZ